MISKPASTSCRQQLLQIMTLQQQQVIAYLDYLESIKHCVLESDTHSLDKILQQTSLGPELIEQTQQQQATLLSAHGYPGNQSGLDSCIQDCVNPQELISLKSQLDERLRELEKSLFVNAYLVRKNQDRVKQSIYILTGHQQPDRSITYSRHGSSENSELSSRSLAEA
ncbi:MAG: flagellar export chaperone FlgN [Gammaproteobacteria bacterium]|nr:flagellar export chaperone FlgN [Gammaproteobacteria bacterium]MBL6998426.1 flagellar export chaperone FlgN [Gammaproteobacteria bacterium]